MLSDAPPSLDEVTTSRVCAAVVEVNTFTSSGMSAPAMVPQLMIVDSFHHMLVSPGAPSLILSSGIIRYDTRYVSAIDTIDVNQTRCVSGDSKLKRAALP